ncbi:MAG: hypothetical protein GF405_04740 [Candidatus Eisenbacteria bacterium]|nr:hypothetical protein [Candidatus Eisenbacteria bacterium]
MPKVVWIPILIVTLIVVAFATTNAYRVPTLEHRFAEPTGEVATVRFVVEDVSCRGKSAGFANMIEDVPGVIGVTTYARTNEAVIEYDPARTNPDEIEAAFSRTVERDGVLYQYFSAVEREAGE